MHSPLKVSASTWNSMSPNAVAKSVKVHDPSDPKGILLEVAEQKWCWEASPHSHLCVCPLLCLLFLHAQLSWGCSRSAVALSDPCHSGLELLLIISASFSACAGQLERKPEGSSCPLGPCPSLNCPAAQGSPAKAALHHLFPHPAFYYSLLPAKRAYCPILR